jgi:hypothetical protein
MTRRDHGSASFEPPRDWATREVLMFTSPEGRDEERPNIIVTREASLAPGSIQSHAMQQLMELSKTFPDFELVEIRELRACGRAAMSAQILSSTEGGKVAQAMVWVSTPEGDILTLTCSQMESVQSSLPALDELIKSLTFTAPASPSRETPVPASPRWSAEDVLDEPPMVPMPGYLNKGDRGLRR